MKAVIYHTLSKNGYCKQLAEAVEGDHFEVKGTKRNIKFVPLQMFVYGFKTVAKRKVSLVPITIDFDKYDEVVIVSPVWAGKVNAFMRQFLQDNNFKNKNITIIGNCDGGYKGYFDSFKDYLDESNKVIDQTMYVKGIRA